MTRKIIPFGLYPRHWGLKGKALEVARAEFELEGTDLRRKIIEINAAERTPDEQKIALLTLDHEVGDITDYQLAKGVIKVNINKKPEQEVSLTLLDLKKEYKKRSENEYEKERAEILGEPWVTIKKIQTDPDNPKFGGVELDWNDKFVEKLEAHGYGPNPDAEDTVNDWFNELCRSIALEAYAGIGDFEEQMGVEETEETKRTNIHEDVIIVNPENTKNKSGSEETDE